MKKHSLLISALCVTAMIATACGSETGESGGSTTTDSGAAASDAAGGGSDATTGSDAAAGSDATTGSDAGSTADAGSASDAGGTEVSFSKQVLPILADHCGFCHNAQGQGPAVKNKVYYKTKADIFALKGKAYTPGDSSKSGLIGILKQQFGVGAGKTLMPPPKSGRPKVPDAEIALVAKWIDEGAKDN